MPLIPPPPPNPKIPRPVSIDEELRAFLKEQRDADLKGAVLRCTDMVMQTAAELRGDLILMKGDIKGASLRIGELEVTTGKLDERLKAIEARAERHEDELDESKRWIIEDRGARVKKVEGEFQWWKRNAIPLVATALGVIGTLYGVLSHLGIIK